ncbi:NUDIX hydrolase [Aspergillus neoniger CBS 115656]|uniref:NUDIX domain protein n=1 Tax=Aspergillus neoniger (strain CBS 115656) TaxID=1448310 RepID=A0A318ZIA9_ASPNB|nr:NUDIX domain protein [Aspergillus neoniger CBS 115656]PYH35742.1 NUDIX domain protein [Aspergillus neoniger CBS 115656]
MPPLNPTSQIKKLYSPADNLYLGPVVTPRRSTGAAVCGPEGGLEGCVDDESGNVEVLWSSVANCDMTDAGQAALPGGRADSLSETPIQTARREAKEEIGLPEHDEHLPRPFTVEHLCEFPANLARTELVVRPCVALLHSFDELTGENADPEVSLIPRLDAREVAAVFTAPFRNFLRCRDMEDWGDGDPTEWYKGAWTEWHQENWKRAVHQFFVPVRPKEVVKPKTRTEEQKEAVSQLEEQEKASQVTRYRVFGMTARMLVDVARVAYAEEPEFEHNSHFGDEAIIEKLRKMGRLSPIRRTGDQLTRRDMEMAAKLS